MMFQGRIHMRQSLHHGLLIVALIVFTQDLSSGGGVQAWTYNYSTSPNRNWNSARQWCQEHFTDMVAIQNQEEIAFLNQMLPLNPNYYWIGIRKLAGVWTWVGTNKSLTAEAENWADGEPNNVSDQQDCVEIYIKRESDMAKWNDERCRKKKGAVCYTASCSQQSCSVHADCVETIGNYTCKCHPGFQGLRCEEAIACKAMSDPEQGSHYCFHSYGSNRFNSSCHFHCDLGYRLVGAPSLRCQANGEWDHPAPLCHAEQCPALNHIPSGGSMNCSHPIAPYSYNSTCEFSCNEGYELNGQNWLRCDPTGQWTASVPTCTVKRCSPISVPAMGNMTCVDALQPFSFGSRCSFTCREGFYLTGHNTLTCLASGQWSKHTPTCTVVQCNSLKAPSHASMQCQDPLGEFSSGSICTMQCEEGFDLIGTNFTQCSSQGNWSHALPVCQAKRCNPINSPLHGSLSCFGPNGSFRFGSKCVSTCEEGFLLKGLADTECTSLGTWSTEVPRCLAKSCTTLTSPPHGSLSCSDPHGLFRFGSRCMLTCEEGFLLNGTADTECTSLGMWSREVPRCLARPCPLLATSPHYGWMNCSHPYSPFSHGSHCDFGCNKGFWMRGTPTMTCNTSGHWSQDLPTCQAVQCEAIPALSSPLSMNCSHPLGNFSFGSRCLVACEEGYSLNGTEALFCSSSGFWSDNLPTCAEEGMPVGTAMLMYTGVGGATGFAVLVLLGLGLLIARQFKKKKGFVNYDMSAWEERENPAFES
ncbi:P-selectin-like [Centroberyx affinis]|uniref:P-selectin-like n=1 Tax=Centroberyx affinis TaxID=166261 RepID=UPI003A5BF78D